MGAIRLVVVETPDLAAPLVGALDAADVGAWVWIEKENCLYWSPLIPDLLGIDPREPDLLGIFLAMVHPEDRPGVVSLIDRTRSDELFLLRFRFRDRDASYRWIEMRGRVERDAGGTLVRQGGTIRDVSREVEQEQEHDRQRQFESLLTRIASDFVSRSTDSLDCALVQALERLGRFLEATIAAVGEVDDQGLLRMTHWWIDPATGRDRPSATELDLGITGRLRSLLEANEPIVVRQLADVPADSIPLDYLEAKRLRSFAIVPARLSDGGLMVMGVAAGADQTINWPPDTIPLLRLTSTILSGVMARRRAEGNQRIVERRMQDAQKLESLGVLAGGIAHDFNNLLTAILGNASLLRSELPNQPAIAGPLEQIEVASRRASDLCRQMLAYAGRGRFALQPIEINEAVRASESLLRVSVHKKAVLRFDLAPGLPPVLADHAQLRQVLMNLIHNAAEAIGDSEGTITVSTAEITCTPRELASAVFSPQLEEGRYVRVAVTDDGAGMTPETLARIFDPFFTTKFTGRGLGLAAVVGIVRVHKGALRVESSPGRGSRFELLLPALVRAERGAREGARPPDAATLALWQTTGTALVIDDEGGVRELVRSVLSRAGMNVLALDNGRAGVDAFSTVTDEVRLVVVDLKMPGLDGRETLAAMHRLKPDLKTILMSGYTRGQVPDAGAQIFLQKPFTPLALRLAAWKLLQGS